MDIVIVALLAITVALLIFLLTKKNINPKADADFNVLKTLNERQASEIKELHKTLGESLSRQREDLADKINNLKQGMNQKLSDQEVKLLNQLSQDKTKADASLAERGKDLKDFFGDVNKQLAIVNEKAGELTSQAKVIGELREILRSPKQRGTLGEKGCEIVLAENLPAENWASQYRLDEGVVDFVVRLGDRLVPVDAKFPLESFERVRKADNLGEVDKKSARKAFVKAVKNRVDEVAKYVNPRAGTVDFAMLFLPGEGIYVEAAERRDINDPSDDILSYASRKRVVIVSPSLLFAYLRTVYLGLESLRIEEKAEEIMLGLASIKAAFSRVQEPLIKLGTHLRNASNQHSEAIKFFDRADTKLGQLTVEGTGDALVVEGHQPELLPSNDNDRSGS